MEKFKEIHKKILDLFDTEQYIEENFQNFQFFLNEQRIGEIKSELRLMLQLIIKIANEHYRYPDFFNKIEQILLKFKKQIKKNFINKEIFNIFKSNKRILLFLINKKIIIIDQYIVDTLTESKYQHASYHSYFAPEINSFIDQISIENIDKEKYDLFQSKRIIGENDDDVSQMIRKDMIEEFITHTQKTGLSLFSTIKSSIFETNSFLIDKEPTLIEYSAFFGSAQIFKYLYLNQVELTPSLWIYSIHGDHPEIIHILEENKIEPIDDSYKECLIESIKCHHNEIANYILKNYLNDGEKLIASKILKFHNFLFFSDHFNTEEVLFNLCRYNYVKIVELLLVNVKLDINKQVISKQTF